MSTPPISQPVSAKKSEVFVPTAEWQQIADGQPLPPGLHIRINLTTGHKEAKLLDKTPQSNVGTELVLATPQEQSPPPEQASENPANK